MQTVYIPPADLQNIAWIDAYLLEEMWQRNSGYLPGPLSEFRGGYFDFDDNDRPIFLPGNAGFYDSPPSLNFCDGRHRTRWLIERGVKEIPVIFDMNAFETIKAIEKKIITVLPGRTFFEIDCRPIFPDAPSPVPEWRRFAGKD